METAPRSTSTHEKPRHGHSHDALHEAYEEFHARKVEAAPEKPEVVSGEVLSDAENAAYEERIAAEQAAREAEARSDLDEVLSDAEPDKPDAPDGEPDYKAQAAEAARASAEAYEKSPTRDRARRLEFWRHYNELKIEQMAERHRVEAEDAKRDEAEARSMNDEMNEERTLANILEDIDNADKIRDKRDRETRLAELAFAHSGVKYPGKVEDLGIEAAKRIGKGKKRHADHYLEKLALEKGNLEAAKSMSRGKYYRPKSRFTSSKGRNAVMSEMIDKALQDGDPYAAEDIIKNHIHGLGKSEASVNARERVASRYDYPEAVMSISGLRNILKKEKAMAKVALELGKKNKTKARALAKTINFQRNLRNDTLVKISKIREDTII